MEPSQRHGRRSVEPPDERFAFVAGLYVACLLSPLAIFGLERWVTSRPDVLYLAVFVLVPGLTGLAGWRLSHWRGLPERIGSRRDASVLLIAAPLVAQAVYARLPSAKVAGFAGLVFGILGFFVAFGLERLCRNRYAAAVAEAARVDATVTARPPAATVRRRRYLGCLILPVAVVAFGGGVIFWETTPLGIAGALLCSPALGLLNTGGHSTYRITAAGLDSTDDSPRVITPWDRFEGYEITDDALVLHWRAWWRPATRYALEDIEDIDAIEDALAEYLPRV